MKRPYFESLALGLGRAMADRLSSQFATGYDVIIPTPQYWLHRVFKRTNSSELIAEAVASDLSITLARTWLRRRKKTKKQGLLGADQRRTNVRDAFECTPWSRFQGKSVLLIDDVLTSGSTASEMARVIQRRGATKVDVAAIARSIGTQ